MPKTETQNFDHAVIILSDQVLFFCILNFAGDSLSIWHMFTICFGALRATSMAWIFQGERQLTQMKVKIRDEKLGDASSLTNPILRSCRLASTGLACIVCSRRLLKCSGCSKPDCGRWKTFLTIWHWYICDIWYTVYINPHRVQGHSRNVKTFDAIFGRAWPLTNCTGVLGVGKLDLM